MAEHQPAFGTRQTATGRARDGASSNGLWHRPEWLNRIADVLLLGASVALGYAAMRAMLAMPLFGFREVVVISPLSQVTTAQLEFAARSGLRGNFFSVSLEEARAAFEKLPWVRRAEVRRVWPATLEIKLEEHVAAAYWRAGESGDTRLVNQQGEVFTAASNAHLPTLSGPEGSAAQVLARYREFAELLAPASAVTAALTYSQRQAWQLRLEDGLVIELGRDDGKAPLTERLARFVEVWPRARAQLGVPVRVADLRYPTGFAVQLATASSNKANQ